MSSGEFDEGLRRVEEGSQGGFVTIDVHQRGNVIKRQHAHGESKNKPNTVSLADEDAVRSRTNDALEAKEVVERWVAARG